MGHNVAVNDELIRLILSVSGEEAISDLAENLAYNEKALEHLSDAYKAGSVTTDEFFKQAQKLSAEQIKLRNLIEASTRATQVQAQAQADAAETVTQAGHSAGNASYKFLQLGQTLDDLQYVGEMGLRPIINNVTQLDARLGIALIAVEFMYRAVGEKLVKAFQDFSGETAKATTNIEDLKKKIDDLEKKPGKVALDLADLEQAKKDLDKIEAQKAALESTKTSSPEKALASLAAQSVTDYGGGSGNLQGIIEGFDRATGVQRGSEADQKRLAELTKSRDFRGLDESDADYALRKKQTQVAIDDVKSRIDQEYKQYAAAEAAKFIQGDPAAIAAMKNRAQRAPGLFNQQGLDGITFGESIANMPGSVSEMRQRQMVDESIASTDETAALQNQAWGKTKAAKQAFAKAQKAAIAKSIADTEKEDVELDKYVDVQIPAAAKQAEAGAEKRRGKQAEAMKEVQRKWLADRQKAQADILNPDQGAVNRLTPGAREHLGRSGFTRDEATAYAPKLAEALLRGADLNIATQELSMQMLSAINDANQRTARAESMMRAMQLMMMRQRQRRPTNQDFPFN